MWTGRMSIAVVTIKLVFKNLKVAFRVVFFKKEMRNRYYRHSIKATNINATNTSIN